jgi:hypothetical protein
LRAVPLLAALLVALLAAGCGSLSPAPERTAELAGQWAGWMSIGRLGHGPASVTVRPDGQFEGTVRTADEDRPFRGAVTALASGALRYGGTFGDGAVALTDSGGRRTLRFVPDGGGVGATFEQVR